MVRVIRRGVLRMVAMRGKGTSGGSIPGFVKVNGRDLHARVHCWSLRKRKLPWASAAHCTYLHIIPSASDAVSRAAVTTEAAELRSAWQGVGSHTSSTLVFLTARWPRGLPFRRCGGVRSRACPIAVCLWRGRVRL